jgi:hypothetical protein
MALGRSSEAGDFRARPHLEGCNVIRRLLAVPSKVIDFRARPRLKGCDVIRRLLAVPDEGRDFKARPLVRRMQRIYHSLEKCDLTALGLTRLVTLTI